MMESEIENPEIFQTHSKEEIIEILKNENPIIQGSAKIFTVNIGT